MIVFRGVIAGRRVKQISYFAQDLASAGEPWSHPPLQLVVGEWHDTKPLAEFRGTTTSIHRETKQLIGRGMYEVALWDCPKLTMQSSHDIPSRSRVTVLDELHVESTGIRILPMIP